MVFESKQNERLKAFGALVGDWATVSTHPMLPGKAFPGRVTFEWVEDGAFLRMRSTVEEHQIPSSVAIIGTDETGEGGSMLYFDERGVSRVYQTSFTGTDWKIWRDAPGFRQRCTATISPAGEPMHVTWELARDGSTWKPDLDEVFTRIGPL